MILCCGEALIDMIPEPTVSGEDGFVPHAGGAVYNTAVALGRLGAQVGMLTGLSSDLFGTTLCAGLEASNVDSSHVIYSDRPTTLAFVHLVNGHASYTFMDENSAGRLLTPADMPVLAQSVSTLYFGGISLACEPGADAYAALLEAEGASRAVMLDPNIRPGFIEDETRYRNRLNRMIAAADIIKVSDEDLIWINNAPITPQEKAQDLLDMGPSVVILTQGGAGAKVFLRGGGTAHIASEQVKVVDTIGAGDTFNAGVLANLALSGFLSKNRLAELPAHAAEEALRYGAKVAAVTVSRAGANPPWAHEL